MTTITAETITACRRARVQYALARRAAFWAAAAAVPKGHRVVSIGWDGDGRRWAVCADGRRRTYVNPFGGFGWTMILHPAGSRMAAMVPRDESGQYAPCHHGYFDWRRLIG
jgi:hypothetical protein